MLSYTASAAGAAASAGAPTTFLSPRSSTRTTHRLPPSQNNNSHNKNFNSILNSSNNGAAFRSIDRVGRGGGGASAASSSSSTSLFASASGEAPACPFTRFAASFGSLWGSFGVIYILTKAIFRVLPIALEPLGAEASFALSPIQWSLYALSCLFFAYAEGYKGFHKKFAPLVVKRSFTLVIGTRQGNNPINFLLAPLYSMGLWGATTKRLIVSWGVTTGVAMVVALVKRLPAAPRCILDAGVVVGLTIGSASILYHFVASLLTGKLPNVDACLPKPTAAATKAN